MRLLQRAEEEKRAEEEAAEQMEREGIDRWVRPLLQRGGSAVAALLRVGEGIDRLHHSWSTVAALWRSRCSADAALLLE